MKYVCFCYYFIFLLIDISICSAYKRLHPEEEEEKSRGIVPAKSSSPLTKKMRNEDDKEFNYFVQIQKVNTIEE